MKQRDLDRLSEAIDRIEAERNRFAWVSILSKPDMDRYSAKYERRAIGLNQILHRLRKKQNRMSTRLYGTFWSAVKSFHADKVEARRARERAEAAREGGR